MAKLKRFSGLFLTGAIWGLMKLYQTKMLGLVKTKAAETYVSGVKLGRRYAIVVSCMIGCAILAGLGLVVVPVALMMLSGWTQEAKFTFVVIWGLVTIGLPLAVLLYLIKEKTWMRLSNSDKMIEELTRDEDKDGN